MASSRQRVAVAALAALLPVAVVALALLREEGDSRPERLPVLSTEGEAAAGDAQSLIAIGAGVDYQAGPDLPVLDGTARAVHVAALSEGDARQLAAAFGVEDKLKKDEAAGGWAAVDGDRTLAVYASGGTWSYFSGQGSGGVGVAVPEPGCAGPDCAVSSEPATTVPPAAPVERPDDLPAQEEAEDLARGVLTEAGIDLDGAAVEAFDNVVSWSFSFEPVVDGLPTYGFTQSLTIGPGGEVLDGFGTAGSLATADEYPLIGTTEAIDRLNKGQAFGPPIAIAESGEIDVLSTTTTGMVCIAIYPPPPGCEASGGVAPPETPPTTAVPTETVIVCPEGGEPTTALCLPGLEPLPAPLPAPPGPAGPVVITLVEAEVVLTFRPDASGDGAWLVPAYRFDTDSGGVEIALAVADDNLGGAQGEPPTTGTKPPDPVEPPATEPGSLPPESPLTTGAELETRPTVPPDSAND
ncbi:MAG: hypothetical protein ACRD0U_10630 [Acidimicrobiales bacterium]